MRLFNSDTGEVYCQSNGTYGTGPRGVRTLLLYQHAALNGPIKMLQSSVSAAGYARVASLPCASAGSLSVTQACLQTRSGTRMATWLPCQCTRGMSQWSSQLAPT